MQQHPRQQHGLSHSNWPLEAASEHEYPYSEKHTGARKPKTSKQFMWRMLRLGFSLALTLAALVLTLTILIVGRHGNAGTDLSLITVNMTDFARFDPPTIVLVNTTTASKTRRGFGSVISDVASAAGSAQTSVETAFSGAASAVESAAGAIATAAEAEADKIIEDIGDALEDIENAVTGLMDKVLDTIQDELNKWLQEAASSLNDLDIPRTMSLHLTTYCSSDESSTNSSSNSTQSSSCSQLFSRGGAGSFNETTNNGTIFGFQPGSVIANALGVFFVPQSAQMDIREPIDSGADTVNRAIHTAGNDLSSWTVNLLFIPIVAVYALACFFASLLLLVLVAATVYTARASEGLPPRVYSLCGTIAAVSAFFLLLGSVILTVIGMVAYIVGLGVGVVGITVSSGSQLKWMSWAAFFIMGFVAASMKVQEFVAECVFWYRFLRKIFGGGKSKGGVTEAMRGLENEKI